MPFLDRRMGHPPRSVRYASTTALATAQCHSSAHRTKDSPVDNHCVSRQQSRLMSVCRCVVWPSGMSRVASTHRPPPSRWGTATSVALCLALLARCLRWFICGSAGHFHSWCGESDFTPPPHFHYSKCSELNGKSRQCPQSPNKYCPTPQPLYGAPPNPLRLTFQTPGAHAAAVGVQN